MHKYTHLAVVILTLAGLWLIDRGLTHSARADDAVKAPAADITVSVDDLKKDFAGDEATATKKYLGKIVRVTGTLKSAADFDVDGKYAFTLDGTPAINCTASPSGRSGAKAISVGQEATIQGKCATATRDEFALSDCQVISTGKDPATKVSAADLAKAYATKNHSSDYRQNLQHNTQIVPQKPLDTL